MRYEFANPLPASVIMDLLGVPRADMDCLRDWSMHDRSPSSAMRQALATNTKPGARASSRWRITSAMLRSIAAPSRAAM